LLNRTHFKRLGNDRQYTLAESLSWNDKEITLVDATGITEPSVASQLPGIVFIDSERIEYYKKDGNKLQQLRRGTFGTGIPEIHVANTDVYDQSAFQNVPYKDNFISVTRTGEDVVSDQNIDYTNVSFTTSKLGKNAQINVNRTGSTYTVTFSNTGADFVVGEVISIPGTTLGGLTPANDLKITVNSVSNGSINKFSVVGTAINHVLTHGFTKRLDANGTVLPYSINEFVLFAGGKRLRKNEIPSYNTILGQDSPEADETLPAEWLVDPDNDRIVFTSKPAENAKILLVRKQGKVWQTGTDPLSQTENDIARFIRQKEVAVPQ